MVQEWLLWCNGDPDERFRSLTKLPTPLRPPPVGRHERSTKR